MNKVKNGVLMVTVGTLAYFFLGVMYIWSVLRIEVNNIFPEYTAAQLSLCFTIMMSTFCVGGFVGGKIVQKRTPAISLRIGSVLILLGYFGAGMMRFLEAENALRLLYISYSVVGGFGIGMGYNALMANISPWFPGRVGLVTGIMMMGMGLSSIVFAFAIEYICPKIGIFNIFIIMAVAVSLMLFVSSFVVKKPPLASVNNSQLEVKPSKKPIEMVSSLSFWIYFLWNTFAGCSGLLVINSAANIAAYFGLAASLGMVISLFNGCGRPVVGLLVDKLGQYKAMMLINVMLVIAAVMLIISDRIGISALMFVGMIFVGIVYGGGSTIATKVINDLYGPKYFGVNHSISNFCVIAASFIGPYLSGILQDRSGGGFTSTFYMLLAISVLMLLLIFGLIFIIKKEK
ncbi:MAG: OFA family MFS transporter [Ruminococcaceae bacterium]|nr:OFA family MFS transporter [Oscillospiraceae bacterium]